MLHTIGNEYLEVTANELGAQLWSILGADGTHSVTVAFPDMPYLGIWHWPKTDAPYVCIEPWVSLPAKHGEVTVFEKQSDLISLEPGDVYANRWTIRAGKR